jgi:hypothetical protein
MQRAAQKKEAEAERQQATQQPAGGQQEVDFDNMTDAEIEAFVKSQEGDE